MKVILLFLLFCIVTFLIVILKPTHCFTFTIPESGKVLSDSRFATLATIDRDCYPVMRIMRTWYEPLENVFYFRSFVGTGKDYQLEAYPKCSLFFEESKDEKYTNITGTVVKLAIDQFRIYYKFIPSKKTEHKRRIKGDKIYISTIDGAQVTAPLI